MPKNIGAYQQGSPIPHAEDQPHESGVPQRAGHAKGPSDHISAQREEHKMVGGNKPAGGSASPSGGSALTEAHKTVPGAPSRPTAKQQRK